MRISKHPLTKTLLSAAIAGAIPMQAMAASSDQEIEALWQTIESLQQQINAAQEWKDPNSLIHMAGYADVNYVNSDEEDGAFKAGTFAPIFHYQYRDLVMLEAEIAFETMDDGSTEANMEYFTTDFFLNDNAILVMGKFLSPLGQFRQNFHPSWINKLPSAPVGFGHDQAAPNADVGVQLRGGFDMGAAKANYAVYAGNGVAAEVNGTEGEIEMVESPGLNAGGKRGKNVGGRFGMYYPSQKLEVGVSFASGKISEMEADGETLVFDNKRDWGFVGADVTWHSGGLDIRAEYVKQSIGELATSAAPEKTDISGAYVQAAYRFPSTKWEVAARSSEYKLGDISMKRSSMGINYIFTSNVVAKLAFENNNYMSNRTLMQLGYGF